MPSRYHLDSVSGTTVAAHVTMTVQPGLGDVPEMNAQPHPPPDNGKPAATDLTTSC